MSGAAAGGGGYGGGSHDAWPLEEELDVFNLAGAGGGALESSGGRPRLPNYANGHIPSPRGGVSQVPDYGGGHAAMHGGAPPPVY